MHDLVTECKRLEIFTHISTAYVICNRKGYIEEKIYEIDGDSDRGKISMFVDTLPIMDSKYIRTFFIIQYNEVLIINYFL